MTLDFVTFHIAALNIKNSHLYFPIINIFSLVFPLETKGTHNRERRGQDSLKAM